MSTRLMTILGIVLVLLGLAAMRVLMNQNHQNRVVAQALIAQQTSLNGVLAKLNAVEHMLIADRAAHAQLVEGCKEVLREAGAQLGGRLEGLLVQQEMRLIRTLEINKGVSGPKVAGGQQVIQPGGHQTILPENPAATRR